MTHNRVFTKECAPNDANIVLVDGTECQGHATTGHFESPFGGLAATEKRCFFCHSYADTLDVINWGSDRE
jgi:hypothetical protein